MVTVDKQNLSGRKFLQPGHGLEVDLAMSVVCANDYAHPGHTQVYVTAWEDHMVTKRNANAASLGVGALGAISLPVNAAEDALIKVGVKMIQDSQFYERYFNLVETIYVTRVKTPMHP